MPVWNEPLYKKKTYPNKGPQITATDSPHDLSEVFDGMGYLPGAYAINVDLTIAPVVQPPR